MGEGWLPRSCIRRGHLNQHVIRRPCHDIHCTDGLVATKTVPCLCSQYLLDTDAVPVDECTPGIRNCRDRDAKVLLPDHLEDPAANRTHAEQCDSHSTSSRGSTRRNSFSFATLRRIAIACSISSLFTDFIRSRADETCEIAVMLMFSSVITAYSMRLILSTVYPTPVWIRWPISFTDVWYGRCSCPTRSMLTLCSRMTRVRSFSLFSGSSCTIWTLKKPP